MSDDKHVIIYDSTGRILKHISGTEEIVLMQILPGDLYKLVEADPETYYIANVGVTDDLTLRPKLTSVASWNRTSIIANGTETAVMTGLPTDTECWVRTPDGAVDQSATVTGTVDISCTFESEFTFHADIFPYLIYEQKIRVVPVGSIGLDIYEYTQTVPTMTPYMNMEQLMPNYSYVETIPEMEPYMNLDQAMPNLTYVQSLPEMTPSMNFAQLMISGQYIQTSPSVWISEPNYIPTYQYTQTSPAISFNVVEALPSGQYVQTAPSIEFIDNSAYVMPSGQWVQYTTIISF